MKKSLTIKVAGRIVMAGLLLPALLFAAMACERQRAPGSPDEAPSASAPVFSGEPVIIGVSAPMEGEAGHFGRCLLHAAQILAQKANAKSGICGRQVLVKAEDDSCMAEKAVEAAKKLVEAGPHAVLGPVCSTAALAALGVYQEAEIVVISPSATEVSLTRSGRYPLFFRTIAPDDAQARLLADFAVNFLNARRIAIVSDSGVYDTMQAGFAAAFLGENPDLAVAAGEFFGQTQVNWQEIAERAALFEAQALIFFGHPADGAKMLAAMRRQGMETAFVADQRIAGPEFAKQAGEYSPGVYACLLPDVSEIPLAEKLVMEYRDIHFIEPCPFYLNAHAAVQALFEALENSGCRKGSGLADALRAGKVATSLGNTGFDENGDIVGHGFAMHSLKDGRFVVMPF